MYGPKLKSALKEIKSFLDGHPKEVVFIDINHFYRMDRLSHRKCVDAVINIFGDKICPFAQDPVTLNWMWSKSHQVVVFYHKKGDLRSFLIPEEKISLLWDGSFIPSPWHNVTNENDLIRSLNDHHKKKKEDYKKQLEDNTIDKNRFYVTQGVLTPDAKLIITKAASSLRKQCGTPAAQPFVSWLQTKKAGGKGVNICIMDFVEQENFISTVIDLNDKIKIKKKHGDDDKPGLEEESLKSITLK